MKTRMHYLAAVAAAGAAAALAACGRAEAGSGSDRPEAALLRVRAVNYSFTAPATVREGPVLVRMTNAGTELHHIQIVRLDSGRTYADLQAALRTPPQGSGAWLPPIPSWVRHVGGPGAVVPGDSSEATLMLEEGSYAILCYVPDDNGVVHFAHGMVRPLTVEPSRSGGGAPPPADIVMVLDDYRFDLSAALRAGRQTIEVNNAASQWHEVVILRMEPGKTGEDFARWEMEGRRGPPPGMPIGGTSAIDPGERNWLTVDLEPGSYALVCFYPDRGDGRPHFMHGMTRDFEVR